MRALILGGCADMAAPLIQLLRNDPEVSKVTLADINGDQARELAAANGDKFEGVSFDANVPDTVVSVMRGHDVALCYVGPFYFFEKRLARCAIEAGIDYVSIADDYDAYLDVTSLEEDARTAGVKILTEFGNSPGITQLLARKGYNAVPHPYRISVNWCAASGEAVGPSCLMHLLHVFNATTLQWFDGKEVRVKTGRARKRVQFPAPIGQAYVYYTGHAESVSLPRNLQGLQEVTVHGGVKPNYIAVLLKLMSALGWFATHDKRVSLARFFHRIESWFPSGGLDKSVGRVDVYGKNDGNDVCKYFTYVGHIADITSIPVYIAAKWLRAEKFKEKPGGVYAAERLLDNPEPFIDELKRLGVDIFESELAAI